MPCEGIKEQVDACGADEEGHGNDDIDDIVELRVSNGPQDDKGKVDADDDALVGPTVVVVFAVCMRAPCDQCNMQRRSMQAAPRSRGLSHRRRQPAHGGLGARGRLREHWTPTYAPAAGRCPP